MNRCVKLHPHRISYLYPVLTEKGDFEALAAEAPVANKPSLSGKCIGLVVEVTDIKRIKCTHLSPCKIIYSTDPLHQSADKVKKKKTRGRKDLKLCVSKHL